MSDTRTLKATFNQLAEWKPEHTAFVQAFEDQEYTYGEANRRAKRIANTFRDVGLGKGDRVAILSRATVDHAIAYFALHKLGAIPATLHTREAPNVVHGMVEDIDADVVLFESQFTELVEPLVDADPSITEYMTFGRSDEQPAFSANLADEAMAVESTEPDASVEPDDTAFLAFSSGTTGRPKAIVHTHETAIEAAHLGQYQYRPTDRDALLMPHSPSFIGWHTMGLPIYNVGGKTVFVKEWNPEAIVEVMSTEEISICFLVPTQWKMILQEDVEEYDLNVRLAGYAGEALDPELFRRLQASITENFFTLYGLSETINTGTALQPYNVDESTLASVGKPLANVDLRIIEPTTHDPDATVERGEIGEVIVRGPSVAKEIWNDPATTEEQFHEDGWVFTGDLGRIGKEHNLYLEGRTDNMIISGGINIHAEGVEGVVERHPDIVECAVIGVPHETWNEAVKAYVVPSDEDITPEELDEWCKANDDLGDYQRPRQWEIVEALPRTNTGKLDRSALREREGVA